MAHVNALPEFKRGMATAYDAVKDGKKHTLKSLRSVFAKGGLKKGVIGRLYRLGRLGRNLKLFDIVIEHDGAEMAETSTFQMVKGAAAAKVFKEKAERYGTLSSSRKSNAKNSAKKITAKRPPSKSKKAAKPAAKKTNTRKVATKKAAVHAGAESSDNDVLES